MLQIGRTLISFDVIEKKFRCDTSKCFGACCVEGVSGAPLETEEKEILGKIYPDIKDYLTREGLQEIEKQGVFVIDPDGDLVTPVINGKECVYTIFEKGVAKCGIEKAHSDNRIKYRKPISCQLYPIRISSYREFDAVNYSASKLCKTACKKGSELNIPVYRFLKDPLIRKYGEDWYNELEYAAGHMDEILQR